MKYILCLPIIIFLGSCVERYPGNGKKQQVEFNPESPINSISPLLSTRNDSVFFRNIPYTGIVYSLNEVNSDTLSFSAYQHGVLHGRQRKWYSYKRIMEERNYFNGKKNGNQVSWWENGNKKFEFTAVEDAYEGEMKEWTVDGKLFHLANYKKGQESGEQKLWYDNGKIRANYVIVNGRRYGLLGTKNCKNVSDSIFAVR